MKKLGIYFSIFSAALILAACSGSPSTTKVSLDFGARQTNIIAADVLSASVSGAAIPSAVTDITVSVYKNGVESDADKIMETVISASQADTGISLDVPSGKNRLFKVTAETVGLNPPAVYAGTNGPVDLAEGGHTTVSIALSLAAVAKNASLTINLLNEDGTAFTITDHDYAVSSIIAEVYIPQISGTTVNLGTALSSNTITGPGSGSAITLTNGAYPETYQTIKVKALASDGMVSFLGGAVVSGLKAGSNTINVRMMYPSQITLNLPSDIPDGTPVRIGMIIPGEIEFTIFQTDSWINNTKFSCPSGFNDGPPETSADREIRIYSNELNLYFKTLSASNTTPDALKWGNNNVMPPFSSP